VKQNRFNVEPVGAILKRAEAGRPPGELIRRVVISEQALYGSKRYSVGLEGGQTHQIEQLDDENTVMKWAILTPRFTQSRGGVAVVRG
jgi:hypothetical protein